MSAVSSVPTARLVASYVTDGARIAAILLVWGVLAVFFAYGVSEIGGTGSLFETIGPQIGMMFAVAGTLNAVLFVLYRAIDYWHQYE